MPVVTLISDLGNNSYHIAAVKGTLLSGNPNFTIVDISHGIKPFHYAEAAFILGKCFRDFPEGTLHLIDVEGDFSRKKEWIIAKLENQYFFTKNTGILSLISDQEPDWCYLLTVENKRDYKFPLKSILAKAAVQLSNGLAPNQIGTEFSNIVRKREMLPTISQDAIVGKIVYITPYNNAITNIHRKHFEDFTKFKFCHVHYQKNDYFDRINNSIHDVSEGTAGCYFDENGFLEIGINGGNASGLLTLNVGRNIWIEFS